eukprot:TRINITY_DN16065_c0_g1_i1.p1 TRINITY_DN16065_c0_g1~~TRINITY_DN16065_c0_g1_i1.p1  ORF type:complete len:115 (-),score=6.91 TRINITY_DN16065_c0_g1_i1:142-486(-)
MGNKSSFVKLGGETKDLPPAPPTLCHKYAMALQQHAGECAPTGSSRTSQSSCASTSSHASIHSATYRSKYAAAMNSNPGSRVSSAQSSRSSSPTPSQTDLAVEPGVVILGPVED